MKYLFFIFLGFCFLGYIKVDTKQQNYLPVYISMLDTSNIPKTFLLNLKAGFGTRKIKTLSRKDVEDYIHNETYTVTENYYKSGGNLADFDKWKDYFSTHIRSVGNSLTLSITIDDNGIINDTVKWDNHTIPINMVNFPKTKWHYMILDSTNARTLLQMSQSIVDSIIASNVLVKE